MTDVPSAREVLAGELDRISERLSRTEADGKDVFFEGSDSYDRAIVAVIRLAALFEDDRRFGALLSDVTERERVGIRNTRNITAHHGYASMDDETFWETITVDMPAFVAKLRAVKGL
ncbi:MAG: antitoxin [Microbacterium sp.]